MPLSFAKRVSRRLFRKGKSLATIAALTMMGNQVERKSQLHGSRKPVLLLYGFGATRRTLGILEKRLQQDGYTVFSIHLGGILGTFNTRPIEDLATYVDQKIERLYEKYQFRGKLSLICHSKGGLIGHYYIKRLGGERRVKMLITLGTPHSGTPWALLASYTPLIAILRSVRQMVPDSPFIRRLKQGIFPKKVKLYSLYSRGDQMCLYPAAVLDPAPNVKNIEIEDVSHAEFLIKKNVYQIIRHALEDEMPNSLTERTMEKIRQREKEAQIRKEKGLLSGAKKLMLG